LQIEAERLILEKEKLRKKLEVDTKQGTKLNVVKLPQLDFKKFSGGLLNWQEFWDSFNSAVHSNPSLSPVEKMNYLRAQLEGDAADVISGLPLTNANYEQSIKLLEERYGQNEVIINAHYTSLMDLPVSSSQTSALRKNYDLIEKHLRSLEALGENIESKILASLIMAKLPKDVLIHLTDQKNDVMNGQCSYSEISCTGTLVTGKMQTGKRLAKLITKAQLETCGVHHRSPTLILTLLLVYYCLNPNYRRISQEERK